jgi:hypothetical protein
MCCNNLHSAATTAKSLQGYMGDRPFPDSIDESKFEAMYLVNKGGDMFATGDLTQLLNGKPDVPFFMSSCNRCAAVAAAGYVATCMLCLVLLLLLPVGPYFMSSCNMCAAAAAVACQP